MRSRCECVLLSQTALLLGLMTFACTPTLGQEKTERFWVAGRYDGNRIVVYFDAVKFEGTMNANARRIAVPVAEGFFEPVELRAIYVAGFQKTPNAEHFAIGDRYDLLLGTGTIATIKVTTLIGCETDEQVGNDSFIEALGTVEKRDSLVFTKNYYAVRRHQEPQKDAVKLRPKTTAEYLKHASLGDEPVRFDIETQVVELIKQRMKIEATDAQRRETADVQPAFKVQPFQVADGTLRYYVRAEWKSGKESKNTSYVLAAWVTTLPTLHILTVEKRTSPYDGIDYGLPNLPNVVGLGDGRTGIIVNIKGLDSTQLDLKEYRDGDNVRSMHALQSISSGE
jgi:hypothetical protein